MGFAEVIAHKRDGGRLDREQIATFVRGASQSSLPPEQLAAMLMAICCRGMDPDETRWLTHEMLSSGELWRLGEAVPEAVDKHSTGGVGDTVSLVLTPLLVAVGVPVAMMSGRGLGHSQGTLDKLEAVPGFRTAWDRSGMFGLLERCNAALVAQTDDVAPADRVLYALRDVTGTVPSLPLIVASIMSKKLALGASTLVLDVKWGKGAFRKTTAAAVELAAALREVARGMGMACEALLTDMNQPLGPALGTACEVRAALDVLAGGGDPMLREVSVRLGEETMVLGGHDRAAARQRLETALVDGTAMAAWQDIVETHGGDPDPDLLAGPVDKVEVPAGEPGWVCAIDGEALGWLAGELGAGRRTVTEPLAHGAGLIVHARLGQQVESGQPLATVLVGERPIDVESVCRRAGAVFTVAAQPCPVPPLVLGTVDDVASSVAHNGSS
jgi:pyrimidine-nucleoside phosphorylase